MMDIPFDSPIAVNTRSNQMLDKLEQQQMKSLVLKHEERQELGEKQCSWFRLSSSPPSLASPTPSFPC